MKKMFHRILEKYRTHKPLTLGELLFENAMEWGSMSVGIVCEVIAFFSCMGWVLGEVVVWWSVAFGFIGLVLLLVGISFEQIVSKTKKGGW